VAGGIFEELMTTGQSVLEGLWVIYKVEANGTSKVRIVGAVIQVQAM
jgi:hypothetical protein